MSRIRSTIPHDRALSRRLLDEAAAAAVGAKSGTREAPNHHAAHSPTYCGERLRSSSPTAAKRVSLGRQGPPISMIKRGPITCTCERTPKASMRSAGATRAVAPVSTRCATPPPIISSRPTRRVKRGPTLGRPLKAPRECARPGLAHRELADRERREHRSITSAAFCSTADRMRASPATLSPRRCSRTACIW